MAYAPSYSYLYQFSRVLPEYESINGTCYVNINTRNIVKFYSCLLAYCREIMGAHAVAGVMRVFGQIVCIVVLVKTLCHVPMSNKSKIAYMDPTLCSERLCLAIFIMDSMSQSTQLRYVVNHCILADL